MYAAMSGAAAAGPAWDRMAAAHPAHAALYERLPVELVTVILGLAYGRNDGEVNAMHSDAVVALARREPRVAGLAVSIYEAWTQSIAARFDVDTAVDDTRAAVLCWWNELLRRGLVEWIARVIMAAAVADCDYRGGSDGDHGTLLVGSGKNGGGSDTLGSCILELQWQGQVAGLEAVRAFLV